MGRLIDRSIDHRRHQCSIDHHQSSINQINQAHWNNVIDWLIFDYDDRSIDPSIDPSINQSMKPTGSISLTDWSSIIDDNDRSIHPSSPLEQFHNPWNTTNLVGPYKMVYRACKTHQKLTLPQGPTKTSPPHDSLSHSFRRPTSRVTACINLNFDVNIQTNRQTDRLQDREIANAQHIVSQHWKHYNNIMTVNHEVGWCFMAVSACRRTHRHLLH